MIRVTRVEAIPVSFRLVEGYRIAGHSCSIAENIIVKVDTSDGRTGFGCAAPAEEVTRETPAAALHALDDRLVPLLRMSDAAEPAEFARRALEAAPSTPAARAACEMALFDLTGLRARVPLARVLGEEVGRVLAGIHRDKGVELITEDSVEAFEGSGRVERVRTRKGRVLECDMVAAGIGIVPNSELLATAGARVDNGVLVDARCRTSLPDVVAAGDVTNHLHPIFGRLRVEHWNNGYQQGQAAARSLLGREQPYDYIHSFWSDQYEHLIEYVGFAPRWDRLVFRGRPESRKFLGFYLEGGIVRAAVGLNRGGDPEDSRVEGELKAAVKLIRNRAAVDPAKLADEAVDLHGLVVAGAR